jgi:DNA-binding NarL/FixJ family response regulator
VVTALTPRQKDVLELLARGLPNRQVARLLGISEWTVREHSHEARLSLGARNTAHAVAIALQSRIIEP